MMGTLPCTWEGSSDYKKKYLFYIKMKPLLVQFVPVALFSLHVAFCEGRAIVLFVATL